MLKRSIIILVIFLLVTTAVAAGSSYPEKPIKLIVPFGAGGLNDTSGRITAEYLEKYLGQPIVIVNISGAGGAVGSREVLNAKPDGYTLLWHHHSLLTAYLIDVADFSWDAFTPVGQLLETGAMMVVKADSPWQNLDDLKKYAEENSAKVKFGVNIGTGSHFGAISVEKAMDVVFTYIGGGGDSVRIPQLLRGDIDVCATGGLTKKYIEAGDLRPLAWLGTERIHNFPEVPTAIEQGYDAKEVFALGLFAPIGVPENIVKTLGDALSKVANDNEFEDAIKQATMCNIKFRDANDFTTYLANEDARLYKLARLAGLLKKE